MVEDGIDRFAVAVNHVEHAGRKARLLEQLPDQHRGRRIALRRLQHEGVAAGNRDRIHPHRYHGGEVERRDAGDDAERLPVRPAVDLGTDIAAVLALDEMRNATGEIDHIDAAGQFAARVFMRLAVLARNRPRDLIRVAVEQLLETKHEFRSLKGRGRAPRACRILRRRYRRIHFIGGREREGGDLLAGRGIEHGRDAPRLRLDLAAADCVVNSVHRSVAQLAVFNTPAKISINWSISFFSMMSGGERAMMSPVARTRRPRSKASTKRVCARFAGSPGMGSNSTAPINPILRTSMTWGRAFSECNASSQ